FSEGSSTMKAHLMALLAVALPALEALAAPPARPTAQLRVAQQGPPPVVEHRGDYDPAPAPNEYFDEGCNTCAQPDNCCRDYGRLSAGYAFVLVQPHREDDLAFTRTVDDGTFIGTSDATFNQDLDLSPRVWLEYGRTNGLGAKVTYWQFDHASEVVSGSPSAVQVETLQTPVFRGLSLATSNPNETLFAQSDIDIDVLDFEGVKWTDFCCWRLGTTAGIRHAEITQGYQALRFNAAGAAASLLNSRHNFDGVGPTFSVEGRRAFGPLQFYSMARGSLLYGNGSLAFTRVEDIDTAAPLTNQVNFNRNDVLTVAEIQVGLEWHRECCNGNMFFVRTAMEGQVWQGVGSAISEDGDLGFFGFNIALGMSL
ncbi:MAG: Lpg1974 family pore-forming outer membrane protein, partial [Pirellulales bacterium]